MKDLSMMLDENVKLNVRTTGVFLNGDKVLVHKCQNHYALPGGMLTLIILLAICALLGGLFRRR